MKVKKYQAFLILRNEETRARWWNAVRNQSGAQIRSENLPVANSIMKTLKGRKPLPRTLFRRIQ